METQDSTQNQNREQKQIQNQEQNQEKNQGDEFQIRNRNKSHNGDQVAGKNGNKRGKDVFIDKDGDGICDSRQSGMSFNKLRQRLGSGQKGPSKGRHGNGNGNGNQNWTGSN